MSHCCRRSHSSCSRLWLRVRDGVSCQTDRRVHVQVTARYHGPVQEEGPRPRHQDHHQGVDGSAEPRPVSAVQHSSSTHPGSKHPATSHTLFTHHTWFWLSCNRGRDYCNSKLFDRKYKISWQTLSWYSIKHTFAFWCKIVARKKIIKIYSNLIA